MGAFPYSCEEGTPAAEFPRQVKDETKQQRLKKIMELQQKIHFANQKKYVGKILNVIVDAQTPSFYVGRTQYDAYDVDAVVYFSSEKKLSAGEICCVEIIDTQDYDLRGIFVEAVQNEPS
jgi:ribosomal protein S12 methylthiotransferase